MYILRKNILEGETSGVKGLRQDHLGQCSWNGVLGRVVGGDFREIVQGLDYVGSYKLL